MSRQKFSLHSTLIFFLSFTGLQTSMMGRLRGRGWNREKRDDDELFLLLLRPAPEEIASLSLSPHFLSCLEWVSLTLTITHQIRVPKWKRERRWPSSWLFSSLSWLSVWSPAAAAGKSSPWWWWGEEPGLLSLCLVCMWLWILFFFLLQRLIASF